MSHTATDRKRAKGAIPRRSNPSVREGDSSYTLTFEAATFRTIKALAAFRGQNLRAFFRQLVDEEFQRAKKGGELTASQVEEATAPR